MLYNHKFNKKITLCYKFIVFKWQKTNITYSKSLFTSSLNIRWNVMFRGSLFIKSYKIIRKLTNWNVLLPIYNALYLYRNTYEFESRFKNTLKFLSPLPLHTWVLQNYTYQNEYTKLFQFIVKFKYIWVAIAVRIKYKPIHIHLVCLVNSSTRVYGNKKVFAIFCITFEHISFVFQV